MRREKILAIIIAYILCSQVTGTYAQPTLPNPGTSAITSDYGPRNFTGMTDAQRFHLGIDYAISGSMHGNAVQAGQINTISINANTPSNSYVGVGNWRYMHILTGSNADNTWELSDAGNGPMIIERSWSGNVLNIDRIFVQAPYPNPVFKDPLTSLVYPITCNVNAGDWIFLANSLNHLHLDRGYGVYQNPYSYVVHTDNINPVLTPHFKYHACVQWGVDFADATIYGNPLVIEADADVTGDKDLDFADISWSGDGQNYSLLKSWSYTGTDHVTLANVFLTNDAGEWQQSMEEGIYPLKDLVSHDAFKYPFYSQLTDPSSGLVFGFKYNDGQYVFRLRVRDVTGHETALALNKVLDNLRPYIQAVEIRKNNASGSIIYQGKWSWNGSALVFGNPYSGSLTQFDDAWIHVQTSEPLHDLSTVAGGYSATLLPDAGSNNMSWTFHIPHAQLSQGSTIMHFTGHDMALNQLEALSNTSSLPGGSIPVRQSNGQWVPMPNPGEDRVHRFDVTNLLPPVAGFSPLSTTINAGDQVQFNDMSTGIIDNRTWTFTGGDPSSSNIQNPLVQYNQAGTYPVKLSISNLAGNDSKSGTVVVTNASIPPAAAFFPINGSVATGTAVHFLDMSTGSPDQWYWDFGGAAPPSSIQDPTVDFDTPGYYTITLNVSNAAGQNSLQGYIYVNPDPQSIDLSCSITPLFTNIGEDVVFYANVMNGQGLYEYFFDFGDGYTKVMTSILSDEFAMHAYSSTGSYNLMVMVTDLNSGIMSVCSESLQVSSGDPCSGLHPEFICSVMEYSVAVNTPLVFTDQTTGGTPPYFYTWHFFNEPGSNAQPSVSFNLTSGPVTVSFPQAGNYPLSLCVSDMGGCSQVIYKNVNVFVPQHCLVARIGNDGQSFKMLPKGDNYFYDFTWTPWCSACQDPPGSNNFPCNTNSTWTLLDLASGVLLGSKSCQPHFESGCGITTVSQQYYNYNFQNEGDYKISLHSWDSDCNLATGYVCSDITNMTIKIVDCSKVVNLCSATLAAGLYPDVYGGMIKLSGPSCLYHILPEATVNYVAYGQVSLEEGFRADLNSVVDIRTEPCPPLSPFDKKAEQEEMATLKQAFEITPNPSDHFFALRLKDPGDKIMSFRVCNLLGGTVREKENVGQAVASLDMGGFPKGIYIVRCKTLNDQYVRKIILK